MDFKTEILRSIRIMIEREIRNYKADKTYASVIQSINAKGYVILDDTGHERTVPCAIQGISLSPGQRVYIKAPLGDLKQLHICGITANERR